MNRAYSLLTVKAVEDEQRIIRGVATTPNPDRVGDVVEPLGVTFQNPMPLLHQHDSDRPVGTVKFDRPTKDGITFEAVLPKIEEPGPLKDRVDTAWGEVKAGLVRAVSIGFRALADGYEIMRDGGIRYLQTEVLELSLVTVPANADAKISLIKSIDRPLLAASGKEPKAFDRPATPGAPGPQSTISQPKGARIMPKTIAEQIQAFEAMRQAKAARMSELMNQAAEEGVTLDTEQTEEYDGLAAEVKSIDAHLGRLTALEKANRAAAKPVEGVKDAETGSQVRSGVRVEVKGQNLPPGMRFARVVRCLGLAQGNRAAAADIAKEQYGDDQGIVNVLKAAVAAGSTSNATWAGALVGDETSVFADFVEFLRPMTIMGKFGANGIPALRRVPFRVALIGQTSGGDGYWVGEGKAKPLTKFDFERKTLEPLKVANIAVVTEETLRDSNPSAETILRDQLAAALSARLDIDFINPAKAAAAGVSPASITNGITGIPSSGNDADAVRADLKALMSPFITANNAPTSGVLVMRSITALSLSLMVNALGQAEFPNITMNGGTLRGIPVVTSEYVPAGVVAMLNASDIYMADDGGIAVDMSREASLQMDNAPTMDSVTPTAASVVSMFQTNSVAFRAERTLNWMRRRDSAVQYLTGVAWGDEPETP
ncbi:phage major capsid protein [Methylobacterium oxalidis]|uniref:Major capsid protein n=1 Tax=Methylobacterium oxalidis TaxID=944322 RepID=A0A512J8Z6_9HYPH|nr:phage major capsid protein [Methylobacterium oxalidis]GEP06428.1 major capsid protein [Methylobacterium oxalidis]GJE33547.1 hypothetical protein LDDCCGHA_3747 [Methylobacterium oxalidis]GLS65468.1 major capsid protein [Methylobacterium oxalidis]